MSLRALLYRRPTEPSAIEIFFERSVYLVRLRRHRQARRYTLRIDAASREVVLTMPPRGYLQEARDFAQKHGGWIATRLQRMPEAAPFVHGVEVPLRGIAHRIVHRRGQRGAVDPVQARVDAAGPGLPLLQELGHTTAGIQSNTAETAAVARFDDGHTDQLAAGNFERSQHPLDVALEVGVAIGDQDFRQTEGVHRNGHRAPCSHGPLLHHSPNPRIQLKPGNGPLDLVGEISESQHELRQTGPHQRGDLELQKSSRSDRRKTFGTIGNFFPQAGAKSSCEDQTCGLGSGHRHLLP